MYTLGIDIGSTSSKAAILQDGKMIVGRSVVSLGTGTIGPEQALRQVLSESGLSQSDMDCIIVTG